jgi:hypothetical protein
VVERLAHPLARAIRPDFTTGRYVEGAVEAAARALSPVDATPSILAYSGQGSSEFVGLTPDGARILEALREAGSYGALRAGLADQSESGLERLDHFVSELHRLGLLHRGEAALTH